MIYRQVFRKNRGSLWDDSANAVESILICRFGLNLGTFLRIANLSGLNTMAWLVTANLFKKGSL